jgi:hypothetical protein
MMRLSLILFFVVLSGGCICCCNLFDPDAAISTGLVFEECSDIWQEDEDCGFSLAVASADDKYCAHQPDPEAKTACEAVANRDVSGCPDSVEGSSICRMLIALLEDDRSICMDLSGLAKTNCLAGYDEISDICTDHPFNSRQACLFEAVVYGP